VREPWEAEIAALPGARLIPMDDLPLHLGELERDREVVVYCHHGIRSAAVVEWLRAQAIPAVNLRGGIDAWTLAVDRTLRRY
jgi:adenylyltransferase/sulfurtransferase